MSIVGFGINYKIKEYIPFYWSNAKAKPTQLQIIAGLSLAANGINNLGQIVGYGGNAEERYFPLIWATPTSKPTTLPLPDILITGNALSINNLSQIVGYVITGVSILGVIWATPNDKPTPLQMLDDTTSAVATGINDLGQIVGYSYNSPSYLIPVIWANANAKPTKLPLPVNNQQFIIAFINGININNLGEFISTTITDNTSLPVFLSSANATPTPLPLLTGTTQGIAGGINNSGQIVGSVGNYLNALSSPVIWANADTIPTALQKPDGYDSTIITGISDSGATPISNICFPAGTPVQTDQGLVNIDDIDPQTHTINNQSILHITKTTTLDNYLISFEKNSLERNIPSHKTLMTKDHKIMFEGKLVPAYRFLDYSDKVKKVKYSGETLYNVLLAEYGTINVNNLMCETLHPDNIIAKLYMREEEEQPMLVYQMNSSLENKDLASYTDVVHKLTHHL